MDFNLTFIGQMIAFAIFVFLTMRYVWPPISQAMEERQKKIADGLSAADRAERDLQLAQEKAAADLKEAKAQAAQIIDQANRRANLIVDEAKTQARTEGERLIERAQSEIEQEMNRAREELRKAVSALVIDGAEKVLGNEVKQDAHNDLLAKLAAEL
ncbi:MAG: F0F1 ATP synthase subunit B [Alcanivorax sp.]|nr:F0F1 ATP synthase subunit B [Alcanivorax sp.]